jgi:hypothetical protein
MWRERPSATLAVFRLDRPTAGTEGFCPRHHVSRTICLRSRERRPETQMYSEENTDSF